MPTAGKVKIGDVLVLKTRMAERGERYIFAAYEPATIMDTHAVLTHEDGVCWGQIGSRISPAIEAMKPGSPERVAAAREWRAAQSVEARRLIVAAFPEAANGTPRYGALDNEIELVVSQASPASRME